MIKSEDRLLLEEIYVTRTHIFIGSGKIIINKAGLYNQILGYLKRSKRDVVLQEWLCERYKVKALTDDLKQRYEDELRNTERSNLYSECLRIKYCDDSNIEFYGIGHTKQLVYLTSINEFSFYNTLIKYLKFNKVCKLKAKNLNYSIMSLSLATIKKEIDECLELDLIPEIDNIEVLSNDPNQYCLAYFDLNLLVPNNNPTPAWDNFICCIKDIDARECFMASLYSLFVGTNKSRQIIYLVGAGNSGKTRVANAINELFMEINSGICTSLEPLLYQDRFSSSSYVYKWFVLAADNKDLNLLRSTLVKNITGNDWVATVEKGQDKDKSHLFSRVFVTSNKLPWCDVNKPEDLSRILLFQLDPTLSKIARETWHTDTMGDWTGLLQNEIIDFFGKCKPYYNKWLSHQKHDLIQYEGMKEILLSGNYFIKRDLQTWWKLCIKKYAGKKSTNVLKINDLCKDFSRFVGSKNHQGKYNYAIKSFLSTMLMENKIKIHKLAVAGELVIEGFEFIEKDPAHRPSGSSIIESEIKDVNNGVRQLEGID